ATADLLRHRQTKGAETDMFSLTATAPHSDSTKTRIHPFGLYVSFSNRPLGSSSFRLSTTTVSMSLTGSRFSSESALRPFHHGFRRQGGTIFHATLLFRRTAGSSRHAISPHHRPARDIFPLLGGTRVFLLSNSILHRFHAAA